jgi:hypothetical protein
MANPSSRQELIDYALRKCGHPVIEVNVDDDQLEDRVDEALQFYQTYHSDAIARTYLKYQITSTDIANKYIPVANQYTYVRGVFPIGDEKSSYNMFDARYQIRLNDVYDMRFGGSLSYFAQTQQYLSTINQVLSTSASTVRFSRHQDILHIDTDWDLMEVGDYVIIDCDMIIDPVNNTQVYNDMWLKRYTAALIKYQWGHNMSKFEGMQLPGGVILNGRAIMEDASAEIEKLEEEIRNNFEMPVDFYVG